MKRIASLFVTIISFSLIIGCASNIPMTSTLNDFVMMGTKVNSSENVSFEYQSEITDGLIKPYNKDKTGEVSGHPGFNHTESTTLGVMLKEYMSNKFTNMNSTGNTKITAVLKDFWLEQYSPESGGKKFAVAMFGGEINYLCIAKIKVFLSVYHNGKKYEKIISTTSEDTYVHGVGTGTGTSSIYKGKNSVEHVHARNINKANNKLVMMINSYLEEIGL